MQQKCFNFVYTYQISVVPTDLLKIDPNPFQLLHKRQREEDKIIENGCHS